MAVAFFNLGSVTQLGQLQETCESAKLSTIDPRPCVNPGGFQHRFGGMVDQCFANH